MGFKRDHKNNARIKVYFWLTEAAVCLYLGKKKKR